MTNLVFVRKKRIKGRQYYYLVATTRQGKISRKIERYLGLHPPSQKDLSRYAQEYDRIKEFLSQKEKDLREIKEAYTHRLRNASADDKRRLETDLITRFTYNTNRIEGSTLTFKDTKMLLEEEISPREKPIRDVNEAENHKKAFLHMKECLDKPITREFILEMHRILKENVSEDAGSFRTAQVTVGRIVPVRHDMIEQEIQNLITWHKKNKSMHPVELACTFHALFERIHPFFDGNGRVGRLLLNFILMRAGFPCMVIQNKNRIRYYRSLWHADRGNYLPLVKYICAEIENERKQFM
ncbi:MAG: Fic family protein [Nanoarchaeota archaeon]